MGRAAEIQRMPPGSIAVTFIGGCQRSGSTLLERMLGQVAGHVSAGEVVHLWSRGVRGRELCGCGEPFDRCPFWCEVGRKAFGGWDAIDVERALWLQRKVDRNRYIIFMLFPRLSRRYGGYLREYARFLSSLYAAIGQVGGGVVVDSSKHASTAFLLRSIPAIRMVVVHLVRDGRGVAYSLGKRVPRPEVRGGPALMHRSGPVRSSMEWLAFNGLFHLLGLAGSPVHRVRYEDLVADPSAQLRAVLDATTAGGSPDRDFGFVHGRTIVLGPDHTVSGNPMRFERGETALRPDDAWRTKMPRLDRRITSLITWPLLRVYGYRGVA